MKSSRTTKSPASGPAPANMPMTTSAMEAALPQPRRRPRPEGGGGGAAKCGWPRALADALAPLRARQLSQSGAGSAWAHISIASSSSMRCARAWSALSASNSSRLIGQQMQVIMSHRLSYISMTCTFWPDTEAKDVALIMLHIATMLKLTWESVNEGMGTSAHRSHPLRWLRHWNLPQSRAGSATSSACGPCLQHAVRQRHQAVPPACQMATASGCQRHHAPWQHHCRIITLIQAANLK